MNNSPKTTRSSPSKIESLAAALETFSKNIVHQETTYRSLNKQFNFLNHALRQTNTKLESKVAELDIITNYLKSILDNIVQGILFIDLNGVVTTYNKAAEAILGIPANDVLANSFWDNFDDEVFGFSMKDALKNTHEQRTFSTIYTLPNHFHSEIEIITTSVLGEHSEPLSTPAPMQGTIVMIKDITEIRHLQTIANRTSRMKELGEMASHVAHEIRNPLGGIKGFASLLKRDLSSMPLLEQMAGYIVEGTDHLSRLVNQVLEYSRPVQLHLENVDLIAMLNEIKCHVLADTSLNQHPLEINIETSLAELPISLDLAHFKSALLNLIVNAIQAMPHGGLITLKAQKNRSHVTLLISDTGVGISEENLSKLFSPFFTTKSDGNGLGLTEVQKVIQTHEGTIDVNSVEGKGTTFIIKLPLLQR